MSVSEKEVQKIAHLSKLNLEGDELQKLTGDFNQILEFVAQVDEVDTSGVKPMAHVLDHANVRREDIAAESLAIDDIRKMAPKFEAGYFVVPKVIDAE